MLDKSSTACCVAEALAERRGLKVASVHALRFASQLHMDYLVCSLAVLNARGGCLDFDPFEVEFKPTVAIHAARVTVVADFSKLGAPGLITRLPWSVDRCPCGRLCAACGCGARLCRHPAGYCPVLASRLTALHHRSRSQA